MGKFRYLTLSNFSLIHLFSLTKYIFRKYLMELKVIRTQSTTLPQIPVFKYMLHKSKVILKV